MGTAIAGTLETDIAYQGSGELPLGSLRLRLNGTQLLRPDGEILVDRLYSPPVGNGAWLCAADEGTRGLGRLRCWDSELHPVTLAVGGRPGRLAIQTDMVAWVASPEGLPQLFIASLDGRIPARALNNVGLQREPGRAPEGFVPPPLGQTLRFDGDWLRWESPDGPHSVRWQ